MMQSKADSVCDGVTKVAQSEEQKSTQGPESHSSDLWG
jgi:hypothetical protein